MARGSTPIRTCVACRTRRPQGELVRLAATADGVRLDPARRLPGRGAYLCPDPGCVDAAGRRQAAGLHRALRGAPTEQLLGALAALTTEVLQPSDGTVRSENA